MIYNDIEVLIITIYCRIQRLEISSGGTTFSYEGRGLVPNSGAPLPSPPSFPWPLNVLGTLSNISANTTCVCYATFPLSICTVSNQHVLISLRKFYQRFQQVVIPTTATTTSLVNGRNKLGAGSGVEFVPSKAGSAVTLRPRAI